MRVVAKVLLLFAVLVIAVPLAGANFSGKWLLTQQGTTGRGRGPAPLVVVLNQVGSDLTGSLPPPRGNSTGSPAYTDVLGGKVDGDTISFYIWTGLDKPVKNYYQGKLTGDEIVFTVTVAGARDMQVKAKRIP